ncbi:conserved hypothetical protein [Methylobacterium sp. 4-46]|uniref:hypothetical protein n=1 Tax=unclassified Methylobacterium TaxID=2615210 RepID=UPI000152E0B1|nr:MULTISPECIES: hypothetical protein [Methylobacterium]ACA15640.1 conserved hypothetical protein [Methylobacterium sp. 4-46]WFT81352.1 hypothetical protein QA634_05525 [Methylobacterium nodulans]
MKRIVSACVAAATLAGMVTAGASPAQAGGWRAGPAIALGAIGGLALGSAIAAGSRPAYGYAPAYGPAPVYVEPDCYVVRRRVVDEFGDVYLRRVRVCE